MHNLSKRILYIFNLLAWFFILTAAVLFMVRFFSRPPANSILLSLSVTMFILFSFCVVAVLAFSDKLIIPRFWSWCLALTHGAAVSYAFSIFLNAENLLYLVGLFLGTQFIWIIFEEWAKKSRDVFVDNSLGFIDWMIVKTEDFNKSNNKIYK